MNGFTLARRMDERFGACRAVGVIAGVLATLLTMGGCSDNKDKGNGNESALTEGDGGTGDTTSGSGSVGAGGAGGSGTGAKTAPGTKSAGASRPAPVNGPKAEYVTLYEQGQFQQAKVAAEDAAAKSKGSARDQAMVVAGMSAQAMKDNAEAERILRPLVTNSDLRVAGRAKAALGLIAQEKGKDQEASQLLLEAAKQLAGDESARASLHAGDSLVKLNSPEKARVQYQVGLASAKDPDLRKDLEQRINGSTGPGSEPHGGLAGGGFTIQLGAFTQKANADKSAQAAAGKASSAGLAAPRVVKGKDSKGRDVWFVRVGQFGSRQAAKDAWTKFGQGVIVAGT
jgi:hypothetical protein